MQVKTKLFNWIGGKKWLSKDLNILFKKYKNKNITTYIEPFAGGLGSFIFTLPTLKEIGVKKVYLNDINTSLISTYKIIKTDPDIIYNAYISIEKQYQKTIPKSAYLLHKTNDKKELRLLLQGANDFFIKKRLEFNKIKHKESLKASALFLFLMQHCFNSVYRENNSGHFNSPYNWETGIPNFNLKKDNFKEYSDLFNSFDIEFYNESCFVFLERFKHIIHFSLLYCDPPYYNADKAENKYNENHFGKKEQILLLDYIKYFTYSAFSNHKDTMFTHFCKENKFKNLTFHRSNIMSSKSTSRKDKVAETLAFKK